MSSFYRGMKMKKVFCIFVNSLLFIFPFLLVLIVYVVKFVITFFLSKKCLFSFDDFMIQAQPEMKLKTQKVHKKTRGTVLLALLDKKSI